MEIKSKRYRDLIQKKRLKSFFSFILLVQYRPAYATDKQSLSFEQTLLLLGFRALRESGRRLSKF